MRNVMHADPVWLLKLTDKVAGQENLTVVIRYSAIVGLVGHLIYIPLFLWLDVAPMAVFNILSCLVFGLAYWLTRRDQAYAALLLGAGEIVTHAVLAVAFIGWESGFGYFILGLTPLIFYSRRWRFSFKVWLVLALTALYIALFLLSLNRTPWVVIDRAQMGVTGALNSVIVFFVVAAVAYVYRLSAITAETALQRANKALQHQALTDPLTLLPNRRQMHEDLLQSMAHYRATREPFCLVLIDIDFFKALNDRYGHEAGDVILVQVAAAMRAGLRAQDRIARWGGEEFLILMAATALEPARLAAERLRERAADVVLAVNGEPISITLTMGVAEYAGEPDAAPCLSRADVALYRGKQAGRNRVVTAESTDEDRVEAVCEPGASSAPEPRTRSIRTS